VHIWL
jgi:hypothetical protein